MEKYKLTTPVLYLVFNRPDIVKETFSIIQKAKPTKLYIGADGPRNNGEKKKTDLVRKYILDNINWKCEVKTLFRDKNLGCKNAVSSAVDWFFNHESEGIILEDDCVASMSYFRFCQEMLEKYRNEKNVMSISGYNYLEKINIKESYYFSRYFECLGWASWKDRWFMRDVTMSNYFKDEKKNKLKDIINNPIERIITRKKIRDNLYGRISAWDHPFGYIHLKDNGICIKPKKNLIGNIGFFEDSTHTSGNFIDNKFYCLNKYELQFPLLHPKKIEINKRISNKEFHKNLKRLFLKKIFWFKM